MDYIVGGVYIYIKNRAILKNIYLRMDMYMCIMYIWYTIHSIIKVHLRLGYKKVEEFFSLSCAAICFLQEIGIKKSMFLVYSIDVNNILKFLLHNK